MAYIPYPKQYDDDFINIQKKIIDAINNGIGTNIEDAAMQDILERFNFQFKEPVQSFADLPATDDVGALRSVVDQDIVYYYDGDGWVQFASLNLAAMQEVIDARGEYTNLNNRLKEMEDNTLDRLLINDLVLDIKHFGAVGDDSTDNIQAFRDAIAESEATGKYVYVSPGKFRISDEIVLPKNVNMIGAGERQVDIITTSNNKNAIRFVAGVIRSKLSDMTLRFNGYTGEGNYGTGNGIDFDKDDGSYGSNIKNMNIIGFKDGIAAGNLWWFNSIENVRFMLCDVSFNAGYSNVGTSINNIFYHCYSDRPKTGGFKLAAFKNTMFINCNFGGRKGLDDLPTYAFQGTNNTRASHFMGCNFEHHIVPNGGMMQGWASGNLKIESNVFYNNLPESEGAPFVRMRDRSMLTFNDNNDQNNPGCIGVEVNNDAKVVQFNNSGVLKGVRNTSSNPVMTVVEEGSRPAKEHGSEVVASGAIIGTNIGRAPYNLQLTVETRDDTITPVVATVAERYDTGFKVRFTKISDGKQDFNNSYRVNWVAY